ncbi:ATP-binding protein [Nitrosopumilus sp.]|uniref:two-component system sensor histidine kinase NtrB n=1 Tax=Nitrosopumilus sp. TaxID=2024843 RepID=UPI00262FA693|nr:ATP-binding protein [Nitrosopumilus sp.]
MADSSNPFDNLTSYELYRSLYENSPDLYRTINLDGIIINCNKSYADTLGYKRSEIIGKHIFEHTDEESFSDIRTSFERWKTGLPVQNFEIWLKKKNGDKFLALLSANNLYDKNGDLIGSNTAIRDITEISLMKKDLSVLKQDRLDVMGELSIRIAHDIKNPLGVIKNYIELIKFEKDPVLDKYAKMFKAIHRATVRIDHQINEVLEFVTPHPLKIQENSLKQIIETTLDELIVQKDVEIILPENDVVINCDKQKIGIAFGNLLLNAMQAMGKTGKLSVDFTESDFEVEITITDTGPGIPHTLTTKIFDPLFTTRQIGTGLGLPITKTIIEQHLGKIDFESKVGEGTVFRFTLPKSP